MKITRYIDQAICIDRKVTVTLHNHTAKRAVVHIQDHVNQTSQLETLSHGEELAISEFGTTLAPIQFDHDSAGRSMTTFEIHHDPAVPVHRDEVIWEH